MDQTTCPGGQNPVHTYSYNAENQMTTTAGATYAYTYDGDGNRVQKATINPPPAQPTPYKLYWFGDGGDPLDETDAAGNTNNSTFNEYIFFSGKRIARRDSSGNIFYDFSDHLGTAREIVQAGHTSPCYDADFYPFGGEIAYVNTCPQNYKFTGKERDAESGLDDFDARYYSSLLGRFVSTDPIIVDSNRLMDPQQLNAYTYSRNNPLRFTDPTGEKLSLSGNILEAKNELCHIIGEACIDGGKNITYDEKTNTLTVDLTGVDLEQNEGAKLLSDLVNSDKQYNFTVGTQYDSQGGMQNLTGREANLPSFQDQIQGPTLKPPAKIDDLVAINPGVKFEPDANCKCPEKEASPAWGTAFHELAEAFAKIDQGMKTYAEGHAEAIKREEKLRQQRPGLNRYLPFSGEKQTYTPMVIRH